MLILMVLGVVGAAAFTVLHAILPAIATIGVSPTAFIAYRRLTNATRDASKLAHTERMHHLEYRKAQQEIEQKDRELAEKDQELAKKKELGELEFRPSCGRRHRQLARRCRYQRVIGRR